MNQDKKLQKAFDQGYVVGINDTHENWIQALRETPGIGRTLEKRIKETMERICNRNLKR